MISFDKSHFDIPSVSEKEEITIFIPSETNTKGQNSTSLSVRGLVPYGMTLKELW